MKPGKKLITLRGIKDLQIPIPKNVNLHYDGFVEDISEHSLRLIADYNNLTPEKMKQEERIIERFKSDPFVCGRLHTFSINKKINNHIFLKKSKYFDEDTLNLAHEETHFLDYVLNLSCHQLEPMEILAQDILDRNNRLTRFSEIEDEEVRADIGGIHGLSLHKGNIYHPELFRSLSYPLAFKIWKKSKIPKRENYVGIGVGKINDWLGRVRQ